MPNMDLEGLVTGLKMQLDNMSTLLGRFLADCKAEATVKEEPKAAKPKNGAPEAPSLDSVKEVALRYAQKHGRDALKLVLKRYEAEKIAEVEESKRGKFLAELSEDV